MLSVFQEATSRGWSNQTILQVVSNWAESRKDCSLEQWFEELFAAEDTLQEGGVHHG